MGNGLPDIAVRDIAIQEREHDLAIATFGRGFYIIDNYSPLRHITPEQIKAEKAMLFPVKDALMYVQTGGRYGTGSMYYLAETPNLVQLSPIIFLKCQKQKTGASEKRSRAF